MKFRYLLMLAFAAFLALTPVYAAQMSKKAATKAKTGSKASPEPASKTTLEAATKPASSTLAESSSENDVVSAEVLLEYLNKEKSVVILDVRNEGQYKSSPKKLPGDIRIEQDSDLDTKLKDVPRDQFIVAYCT